MPTLFRDPGLPNIKKKKFYCKDCKDKINNLKLSTDAGICAVADEEGYVEKYVPIWTPNYSMKWVEDKQGHLQKIGGAIFKKDKNYKGQSAGDRIHNWGFICPKCQSKRDKEGLPYGG